MERLRNSDFDATGTCREGRENKAELPVVAMRPKEKSGKFLFGATWATLRGGGGETCK